MQQQRLTLQLETVFPQEALQEVFWSWTRQHEEALLVFNPLTQPDPRITFLRAQAAHGPQECLRGLQGEAVAGGQQS